MMRPEAQGAVEGILIFLLCVGLPCAVFACAAASQMAPPVMEAAIKHFQEVLKERQVSSDRLKCEVEVHQGTALMLCEAKLPGAKP